MRVRVGRRGGRGQRDHRDFAAVSYATIPGITWDSLATSGRAARWASERGRRSWWGLTHWQGPVRHCYDGT